MKAKLLVYGVVLALAIPTLGTSPAWAGLKQAGANKTCSADPKCSSSDLGGGGTLYCIKGGQHCLYCANAKDDCQVMLQGGGQRVFGINPTGVLKESP